MLSTDTDPPKTYHIRLHIMIRTHNFEPNVKFDFDESVGNCKLSLDTSKLNLMLGTLSGICPGGGLSAQCNLAVISTISPTTDRDKTNFWFMVVSQVEILLTSSYSDV